MNSIRQKKKFKIDKTIIFENEKTIILPESNWCCEKFHEYVYSDKIHFDKPDKYGNEYPYVELLTLDNSAPPKDRSARMVYLTHCMFCGYQYNAAGQQEQFLSKHNKFNIK